MDEEGFIQSAGQIESDDVAFIGRRVYDDELFPLEVSAADRGAWAPMCHMP